MLISRKLINIETINIHMYSHKHIKKLKLINYLGCSDIMGRAKSMSSTTLISEVASLVGLPKKCTPRLSKRKAPCAVEDGYDSSETLAE